MDRKLKIIQFIHGFSIGGAEKLVCQYSLLLDKSKFDVYVIAITNNKSIYDEILASNKIKVFYLNDIIDNKLRVPLIVKKIAHVIARVYLLRKYIKRINPDIIHTHLLLNDYVKKARIKNRIGIVHTVHSDAYRLFDGDSLKRKEREAVKSLIKTNNVRFIALNEKAREDINTIFNVNDTVIINNGIDIAKYQELKNSEYYRIQNQVDQNKFVVCHVGRLSTVKNQSFLIDIFSHIVKTNNNSELWLIGEGSIKKQLEEKIETIGLSNKVKFWGNVTNPEIYVKMSNVFIMPSLIEGVSLSMIECQVIGTQMLVSDTIPSKGIISNLVSVRSLNASPSLWAIDALRIGNNKKIPEYFNISEWDIKESVKDIENLYVMMSTENRQ